MRFFPEFSFARENALPTGRKSAETAENKRAKRGRREQYGAKKRQGRAPLRKGRAKNRANKIGTGRTSDRQVRGEKQNKCARRRQIITRNGQRAAAPDHTPQRTTRGGARS